MPMVFFKMEVFFNFKKVDFFLIYTCGEVVVESKCV